MISVLEVCNDYYPGAIVVNKLNEICRVIEVNNYSISMICIGEITKKKRINYYLDQRRNSFRNVSRRSLKDSPLRYLGY